MAITQGSNLDNPFEISKLSIGGKNFDEHFINLTIEESMNNTFMIGKLVLSRLVLEIPEDFDDREHWFLNKELVISFTTDLKNKSEEYNKTVKFLIYEIGEKTDELLSLVFIQKEALKYLTQEFSMNWKDKEIYNIISDIFSSVIGTDLDFQIDTSAETLEQFSNPRIWSPVVTVNNLLPRMEGGYFLFSNMNSEIICKKINTLLEDSDELFELSFINKLDERDKFKLDIKMSKILGHSFSSFNNLLAFLRNNSYGISVDEYDIETKEVSNNKIKNINNYIKLIGSVNPLLDGYDDFFTNKTYLKDVFGSNIELNKGIKTFVKNNMLEILIYGNSKLYCGKNLKLNLEKNSIFLTDPNSEIADKNLIYSINHVFNKNNYYQRLRLFKSGFNKYTDRDVVNK